MRRFLLAALAVPLLLAVGSVADAADELVPLGTAFTGRPFVIEDDLVLETDGLVSVVRDVADPEQSTLLGWLDHSLTGYFGELMYDGGLLVAIHGQGPWGYEIVKLDPPAAPEILTATSGTSYTSGWFRGDALYLATSSFCAIYDVSRPAAPTFAGVALYAEHPLKRWFSELDGVLYAIDEANVLRGLDVSDPFAPVDLGTTALAGTRIDAMVPGDGVLHLLVTDEQPGGFADVSVRTLAPDGAMTFTVTGEVVLASGRDLHGLTLARDDDLLLAAVDDGTVHGLGLADPPAPERGFVLPRFAAHVAVSANQLFVLEGSTLHVYGRVAHDEEPPLLVTRTMLPRFETVFGDGPVALAQRHDDRSVVVPVDVSNPRLPRRGDPVDLGFGRLLGFDDDLLAVTDGSQRLDLWDVSDPQAPLLLRTLEHPESRLAACRIGGATMACEGLDGVGIILYDVSDPARPVSGAGITTAFPRAVDDGLLIAGFGSRVRLYDVADVHRPRLAAVIAATGDVAAVTLADGHAYLVVDRLADDIALRSFDLADPTSPQEVGSLPLDGSATRLVAHGHRLYAQGFATTRVIDVTDPATPVLVGEFDTWGQTGRGLAFHDDVTVNSGLLICYRDEGYMVTPTAAPAPVRAALEPAFPNPFNPSTTLAFSVARAGTYGLSIHDLRGRRIVDLVDGPLAAGRHTATWHGRDAAGRPVGSGTYLVRLHGPGVEATRTVTLVQ